MKKILFFIVLLSLNISNLYAQQWEPLGPNDFDGEAGFSTGEAYNIILVTDSLGTIYIAYLKRGNGFEINLNVKKFDGNSWVNVGAKMRTGWLQRMSLAINKSDVLFVAYTDGESDYKNVVKKFDGNSWVGVSNSGDSEISGYGNTLAIDNSNMLYVAYIDKDSNIKVKKFDGSSWIDTGIIGLSRYFIDKLPPLILKINSLGTPYITYRDSENDNATTIKKFDDNSWVNVGNPWSSVESHKIDLTIDASNIPYVFYYDDAEQKAIVKKFNGTFWIDIGTSEVTVSKANILSIITDINRIPYVAYNVYSENESKAIVKRFDGISWVKVGIGSLSAGAAFSPSISFDNSDNLIVAYSTKLGTYAKKLNTTALGVDSFADNTVLLYPNPVKDNLNINVSDDLNNYLIEIFDILGRNIYENSMHGKIKSINLERLTTGVYNIRLTGNNKQIVKKIIKL